MPRLIDADKLFNTLQEQEMWNVPDFVYKSIQKAPTVEAITVEWLKRWFAFQVWCGSSLTDRVHCKASDIIEDWKKENMLKEWEKKNVKAD